MFPVVITKVAKLVAELIPVVVLTIKWCRSRRL